ncbi:hypothetical protein HDU76_010123 [Blyttiomyces sp. JEL0837]|nr:hypothetical protein HDU76_010123 [Blyttiomyces sp. JEL0837]
MDHYGPSAPTYKQSEEEPSPTSPHDETKRLVDNKKGGPSQSKSRQQQQPGPQPPLQTAGIYQDVWASIFFGVAMSIFVIIAFVMIPCIGHQGGRKNGVIAGSNGTLVNGVPAMSNGTLANGVPVGNSTYHGNGDGGVGRIHGGEIAKVIGIALFVGASVSVGWFFLILKHAGPIIHISYILSATIPLLFGILSLILGLVPQGIILTLLGGLLFYFYNQIKLRIPFAEIMLKTVTRIILQYSGTVVCAFVGLVVSGVFNLVWIATVVGGVFWFDQRQDKSGPGDGPNAGAYALMVFLM